MIRALPWVLVLLCCPLFAEDAPLATELARISGIGAWASGQIITEVDRVLPRAEKFPAVACQLLLLRLGAHKATRNPAGVLEDALAIAKTGETLNMNKADDVAIAVYEATYAVQGPQAANEAFEKHAQSIAGEAWRLGNLRMRQAGVCIDAAHDYETATTVLENLRAKNLEFAKAADLRLIDLAVAKNDLADAIARSRKALEIRASQMSRVEECNVRQRLGDMLLSTKQYDEARAAYTRLMADLSPAAAPKSGVLAAAQAQDRKRLAAVAVLVGDTYAANAGETAGVHGNAGETPAVPGNAGGTSTASGQAPEVLALAQYRSVILTYPDCRESCFAAQKAICTLYHDAKQYDKALVAAVRLYGAADSSKAIGEALPCILRALHAIDGNLVRVEGFVSFLKAAETGAAGTGTDPQTAADRSQSPKNPLEQYFQAAPAIKPDAEEDALLQAALAKLGNTMPDCTTRGTLYLYFGLPRPALGQFKKVFLDCNFEQARLQAAADDVAVGLKAYYGQLSVCAEFFEFQRFGTQGKDGQGKLKDALKEF